MLSGMLGMMAATRSPIVTPASRNAALARATSPRNSSWLIRRATLSSPRKMSAGSEPFCRSRFSAKFSLASGKKRAPGILSASTR
jgi:hypothetical protein